MTQGEFFGYVIDVLEKLKILYMVTGSIASIAYSKPRLTLDMDIIIDISSEQAKKLVEHFGEDYHVDLDGIAEAIRSCSHFNIIHIPSASKVDFYLLKPDLFNQEEFARQQRLAFDDKREASFASPEDIILGKLDFYQEGKSEKHLDDIQKIIEVIGNSLDISYIEHWAKKSGTEGIWFSLKKKKD